MREGNLTCERPKREWWEKRTPAAAIATTAWVA